MEDHFKSIVKRGDKLVHRASMLGLKKSLWKSQLKNTIVTEDKIKLDDTDESKNDLNTHLNEDSKFFLF